MRNDARPIGHDQSPVPHSENDETRDSHESVTRGRESHVVNRGAADNARRDHAGVDPTMPTGDSTLPTKI